jgi:hypothetical protein
MKSLRGRAFERPGKFYMDIQDIQDTENLGARKRALNSPEIFTSMDRMRRVLESKGLGVAKSAAADRHGGPTGLAI